MGDAEDRPNPIGETWELTLLTERTAIERARGARPEALLILNKEYLPPGHHEKEEPCHVERMTRFEPLSSKAAVQ